MSRRWSEDVFKLVKVSATQVKLASGSAVTIGGQQAHLAADIFLTPSLTANAIYMIYAVRSGGVVSLVASTNANSVGPVGYTAWKLVGALLTNNSSQIGSLLDLNTGSTLEPFENDAAFTMAANFGTLAYYNIYQEKIGTHLKVKGSLVFGVVSVGSQLYIQIPQTIDFVRFPDGASQIMPCGQAEVRVNPATFMYGSIGGLKMFTDGSDTNKIFCAHDSSGFTYAKALSNVYTTGQGFGFQFQVPIVGWSSTPLKDL